LLNTSNTSVNRIPSSAEAVLDIRFTLPLTTEKVLALVHDETGGQVIAEPIISAEPTHLSPDPAFVEVTSRVTNTTAELVRSSGGSDARFICKHGIPALISRPLVGELHSEDEWIDIGSMVTYHRICEEYILGRSKNSEGPFRAS
jgi:succinyl-diaminopimelate desuccinylase